MPTEVRAMYERANVFSIHSWDDADACRRMEQLLRGSDPLLAHYSLLPERSLPGTDEEIIASIISRLQFATAVVVLNTPGLHRRPWSAFEMETAVRMGKRIVVIQPHRQFTLPIPEVLNGNVYYYANWRSDVVGHAIRGEYPDDRRTFDIAEVADRRRVAGILATGVAALSFVFAARAVGAFLTLQNELAAEGVELRWDLGATGIVLAHSVAGALIGGLLGAISDDEDTALYAAAAGAAVGAAVGLQRLYRAQLTASQTRRVLTVESV